MAFTLVSMRPELRTTLVYASFGVLWILLSDALVFALFSTRPTIFGLIQTYKGWLYVGLTATGLFFILRREFGRVRQREATIQQKEADFRYLFLNNPQPMWVYDRQSLQFLEVNPSAQLKYGYSRDEFLAMKITDIRPAEDVPKLMGSLGQPRAPLTISEPRHHRKKDGQLMDVEVMARQFEFYGHDAALVTVWDVTEREVARKALQASEQRLSSLVNSIGDVIYSSRQDVGTVYISASSEKLYGRKPEEFYQNQQLWLEVIHPDDRAKIRLAFDNFAADGHINVEYRIVHVDGTTRWVNDRFWVIKDADGGTRGGEGIVIDITEQHQLEQEKSENEKLRLALNQEMKMRQLHRSFIALISHEFRTPLATIQTSANLLNDYQERLNDEQRAKHFQRIYTQIARLIGMLDDVFLLMKADTVGLDFQPAVTEFDEIVRMVVKAAQVTAATACHIHLEIRDTPLMVYGDARLLERLLVALVSNAVKYSREAGDITVTLQREGDEVALSVKDGGMGVATEDLSHIFDIFYRGKNAEHVPGLGLGLAIVKQIVDLHGGRISVESEVGMGCLFTVALPMT